MSFTFRSLALPTDTDLLHSWIATEHAAFWGMPHASKAEIFEEYSALQNLPDYRIAFGMRKGAERFLIETYDPAFSPLADVYPAVSGDRGLHFLCPKPTVPEAGFTLCAFESAIKHIFTDPFVERIIVEPDIQNKAIQALNARVGFQPFGPVQLREANGTTKNALLSCLTRSDFERSNSIRLASTYLSPERWNIANRHLLAKSLAEFSHERLLDPVEHSEREFSVQNSGHRYRFQADKYQLNHWLIDEDSIIHEYFDKGSWTSAGIDVLEFITIYREELGMSAAQLPTYLEELSSTLRGHCYKQVHSTFTSDELAEFSGTPAESFQRIESSMTEGHPCFVANNGRMGLGQEDYLRYAPETGSTIRLGWVAAHCSRAQFDAIDSLDYEALLEQELGASQRLQLNQTLVDSLADTSLDAEDFIYIPVHPWQWENRLSITFANDIASRHLIWLGYGEDRYQPQQSIRTFFNRDRPAAHYVKTAMSVLNMGFMRGLSADYMKVTPAINQWLGELFESDPVLSSQPIGLLKEIAAVGYRNPQFEAATSSKDPQRKMLAALWRESPVTMLGEGEKLATMASLLHVDAHGTSFAGSLIRKSGLSGESWLRQYLDAYLIPLVHCLTAYDLVFMPHGENVILVIRDGGIERVLLKDLGEEIAVLSDRVQLPEQIRRVRTGGDPVLSVFTDIFDSFFRFLAPLLEREGLLSEERFWETVGESLMSYRSDYPELSEHFDSLGLFSPAFPLSCLNRLQLRNNQQMLDLTDQSGGLLYAGDLENPLAQVLVPAV